ncbi:MAG TPA: rRNA maturation RNase YbeY, partial [Solirubrobacteraceae bacterium]|nr:rRNA maturation RNase YbeY [Solirubrobacteraceae bacterium]
LEDASLSDSLEIEVVGVGGPRLPLEEIERLLALALGSGGIDSGHVALEFVSAERIAELNLAHRAKAGPTDVLSFPIDGSDPVLGPREIGDIVICPEHTADLREAIVHGALHLTGMDHETDDGEMLAVQREIMSWISPEAGS